MGPEPDAQRRRAPDALERFGARYPEAKRYDRLDAALADPDIDAVIVATPSGLHFEHARAALEAGKHVMVEKPLAHTVAEAVALTAMAAERGLTLMVGHTFLYNNIVHEVKRRIDAGDLGEIFYAYSQRLALGRFRRDSDVMWTLAPHDISILNYFFDAPPVRVSARGHTYVHRQVPDAAAEVCFAQLAYPDGRSAHLHLSWLDPQKRRDMVLVGSERMLVYDDMNPDAHIRIYDKKAESEFQGAPADFADFGTRVRAGDLTIPNIRLSEPLASEIDHFVTSVLTDGHHGTEVVAVMEALSRSMAEDGAPVDMSYPEPGPAHAAG